MSPTQALWTNSGVLLAKEGRLDAGKVNTRDTTIGQLLILEMRWARGFQRHPHGRVDV